MVKLAVEICFSSNQHKWTFCCEESGLAQTEEGWLCTHRRCQHRQQCLLETLGAEAMTQRWSVDKRRAMPHAQTVLGCLAKHLACQQQLAELDCISDTWQYTNAQAATCIDIPYEE